MVNDFTETHDTASSTENWVSQGKERVRELTREGGQGQGSSGRNRKRRRSLGAHVRTHPHAALPQPPARTPLPVLRTTWFTTRTGVLAQRPCWSHGITHGTAPRKLHCDGPRRPPAGLRGAERPRDPRRSFRWQASWIWVGNKPFLRVVSFSTAALPAG